MKRSTPEILAPAGSMEALTAALRTGADAVYVGGKNFSARNSAENFTLDELAEAADMCRLYNAKLFLAVNTVISDGEAEEFCEYIKNTAEIGINAYIVQDFGCAELIRRCVPDAVLHASTQMTVHTVHGAKFIKELEYARVVPARELDKNTLKKICGTGIETEIFVHGALCMSVSGQCYMSAVIGSRSANRGCCGQACRLPFSACGNMEKSALSLKDLSLIPRASELAEIGADSLKIEGRMKRPEYVAASVNALRNSFDGKAPDMQLLRGIFSRGGFTDGYFTRNRTDMFGVREKNDVVSAQSLIPKIHELYRSVRKVHKIDFHAVIKKNMPVSLTAVCGNLSVDVSSEPPQTAQNRPTDLQHLEKQLSRLGDTVFSPGKITAEIENGLIVPAGKINELRRKACEKLSALIISREKPRYTITDYKPSLPENVCIRTNAHFPIRTVCRTAEQARAAIGLSEYIILPTELLISEKVDDIDKTRVIIYPPRFIKDEEKLCRELNALRSEGYSHLMCHTIDCIAIGKSLGFTLHGDFGLNVLNSYSTEFLQKTGLSDFTVSFEARISQINAMSPAIPMGAVIFGKLPLMLTVNCPIKNEIGCRSCQKLITDRTGRAFPVNCCGDYTEILNSDTLYMFDKLGQFSKLSFGTVMLSDEDSAQTIAALNGAKPSGNITRGLYYRGI